jgi:hypothetical protein
VFLIAEQEIIADRVTGSPGTGRNLDEEAPERLSMLPKAAV